MNSNKNWALKIDENVYTELRKIPKKDSARIIGILGNSDFSPYSGDIEKIKGESNLWRRRIGAYRVFYEIKQEERTVHVFWIERRTSKTY